MERMTKSKLKELSGIILMVFIVFVISLTASVEYAASETPRYGGVLKMIYRMTPRSLGWPSGQRAATLMEALPCIETLVGLDKKGLPKPFLATDWKYGPDFKSLTFSLRKGVKFHDGSEFNAEAVKANLDERKAGRPWSVLQTIASVDVIDPYAVKLNLKEYDSTFLTSLAFYNGLMISPKAIDKGKKWAANNPVGTGPFEFVSLRRDVALKYKKFEGYWDKGKPYLDGLETHFIKNRMTAIASFEAQEAHIMRWLPPKDAVELKKKGYEVIDFMHGMWAMAPDSANPKSVLADKRVREAIEYGINRNAIIDAVGYGYWHGANQFAAPPCDGYNPDYQGRPYNPAKAKQLLTEAGYPNGLKIKIITAAPFISRDIMAAVKDDLKKVGIDAELKFIDLGKYFSTSSKGWKDALFIFGTTLSKRLTRHLYQTFKTKAFRLPSMLRSNELDAVFKKARNAPDYETQTERIKTAVRMISDSALVIPFYYTNGINAIHEPVRDLGFNDGHHLRWTPANAWLSK